MQAFTRWLCCRVSQKGVHCEGNGAKLCNGEVHRQRVVEGLCERLTALCTSSDEGFTATASSPKIEIAAEHLARYVEGAADWAKVRNLNNPIQG